MNPRVFVDDVPHTTTHRVRQSTAELFQVGGGHVAQGRDVRQVAFQQVHACLALLPPLVVGRIHQPPAFHGVADDNGDAFRQRHWFVFQ